jgi:hypothetical protein
MNAIRIHTQLSSTTLDLPELAPMVGKQVELIVIDEGESARRLLKSEGMFPEARSLDVEALDNALSESAIEREVGFARLLDEFSR